MRQSFDAAVVLELALETAVDSLPAFLFEVLDEDLLQGLTWQQVHVHLTVAIFRHARLAHSNLVGALRQFEESDFLHVFGCGEVHLVDHDPRIGAEDARLGVLECLNSLNSFTVSVILDIGSHLRN